MNSREDIEGIMTATKDAHKMIDAEVEDISIYSDITGSM